MRDSRNLARELPGVKSEPEGMSTLLLLVQRLAVLPRAEVDLPLLPLLQVHPDNLAAHDARVYVPVLERQAFGTLLARVTLNTNLNLVPQDFILEIVIG